MSTRGRILAQHVEAGDDPDDEVYWAALTIVVDGKRPTVIQRPTWAELWDNGKHIGMALGGADLAARLEELGWELGG